MGSHSLYLKMSKEANTPLSSVDKPVSKPAMMTLYSISRIELLILIVPSMVLMCPLNLNHKERMQFQGRSSFK